MSNQEILEKAIRKAINGGWNAEIRDTGLYVGGFENCTSSYHGKNLYQPDYNIIFNHDFAKALWGEDSILNKKSKKLFNNGVHKLEPEDDIVSRGWQYHLQQMVIADDPIKYLGENI